MESAIVQERIVVVALVVVRQVAVRAVGNTLAVEVRHRAAAVLGALDSLGPARLAVEQDMRIAEEHRLAEVVIVVVVETVGPRFLLRAVLDRLVVLKVEAQGLVVLLESHRNHLHLRYLVHLAQLYDVVVPQPVSATPFLVVLRANVSTVCPVYTVA